MLKTMNMCHTSQSLCIKYNTKAFIFYEINGEKVKYLDENGQSLVAEKHFD